MVNCSVQPPNPKVIGDGFSIRVRQKDYNCLAFEVNKRVLYRIEFNGSFLYITKTINQHGIPFWTSIPQSLKLRHIVSELGNQLEDHLIKALCVTTTVLK